jgi:hypothetical protein
LTGWFKPLTPLIQILMADVKKEEDNLYDELYGDEAAEVYV